MSVPFDLKALSDELRDELLADPAFGSIPALSGAAVVVTEDPQDINTDIENALNTIGLGLMVMLPHARRNEPNIPGPYFDDITVVIVISETPTINRAATNNGGNNPTSYQSAMLVCGILDRFKATLGQLWYVTYVMPVETKQFSTWNVGLKTGCGMNFSKPLLALCVATPATPGDQTVTLTCATLGAAIFYTLDGTYPGPRTGLLYTAPIAVAAGQLLRARAWLAGYAPTIPAEINVHY